MSEPQIKPDELRIMLTVPAFRTSEELVQGKVGEVVGLHWAEARAAEAGGFCVVLEDPDNELWRLLK